MLLLFSAYSIFNTKKVQCKEIKWSITMESLNELRSKITALEATLKQERKRELESAFANFQALASRYNLDVKLISKSFSSAKFWDDRYAQNGNSGAGSYGRLAQFKADIINKIVEKFDISSVVEFGCGDGNQLKLSNYDEYLGYDVSEVVIESCHEVFSGDNTKKFKLLSEYVHQQFDLALSLDVIYHLIEDDVYDDYLHKLFSSSSNLVIVYSSNVDRVTNDAHVKHREFCSWVALNYSHFHLIEKIENIYKYDPKNQSDTSFADFYIFQNTAHAGL